MKSFERMRDLMTAPAAMNSDPVLSAVEAHTRRADDNGSVASGSSDDETPAKTYISSTSNVEKLRQEFPIGQVDLLIWTIQIGTPPLCELLRPRNAFRTIKIATKIRKKQRRNIETQSYSIELYFSIYREQGYFPDDRENND